MKQRTQRTNIEDMKLNPKRHFEKPQQVLSHEGLSVDEKTAILEQWQDDASLREIAEAENMPGANVAEELKNVSDALHLARQGADAGRKPRLD